VKSLNKLGIDDKWLAPLEEVFAKYGMNTPERQAAFIGQCMHESGKFKTLQENLNYSADRLHVVWPSRFPTVESAKPYDRNPQKIANRVYGGRMGNGTEETGEGYKYRGRGLIQLTGKDNYVNAAKALDADLVNNPDLVSEPKYAALTAGWFWNKRNLNVEADAKDYMGMTKKINGGVIGLNERIANINSVLKELKEA
jgi:putative chitinase